MLAKPDPTTFQILPWKSGDDAVARMFCDIVTPDGDAFPGDPATFSNVTSRKPRNLATRSMSHQRSSTSTSRMPLPNHRSSTEVATST